MGSLRNRLQGPQVRRGVIQTMSVVLKMDDSFAEALSQGKKRITIRRGTRLELNAGEYIRVEVKGGSHPAIIESLEFASLDTLDLATLHEDGFEDLEDATAKLRRYYPDLQPEEAVTVIRFTPLEYKQWTLLETALNIQKRAPMYFGANPNVEHLYAFLLGYSLGQDQPGMSAKPVPDLIQHLSRLKRTGCAAPGPKEVSFEEAIQELVALARKREE